MGEKREIPPRMDGRHPNKMKSFIGKRPKPLNRACHGIQNKVRDNSRKKDKRQFPEGPFKEFTYNAPPQDYRNPNSWNMRPIIMVMPLMIIEKIETNEIEIWKDSSEASPQGNG